MNNDSIVGFLIFAVLVIGLILGFMSGWLLHEGLMMGGIIGQADTQWNPGGRR